MAQILYRVVFTVMVLAVGAGCAADPLSDRQPSRYGQENTGMGPDSGRPYRFDEYRRSNDPYNDPYGAGGRY